jgi:peptidoglycan-associated lipoprotein
MKVSNYAVLAGAAAVLAACNGAAKISDIENQRVFFAFDSAEINKDAKDRLGAQAEFLKQASDIKVQVAGNCDERGTEAYNLALGARRANAAKQVLVGNGIEAKRIKTISYGKDRPWVKGTGEKVWSQNRNATTTVAK